MTSTVDYLLIGHVTADLTLTGRSLGGTVSYAAPIAQSFGHRVGIVTSAAACEPLLADLLPHADLAVHTAEETTTFENIYHGNKRTQFVHEFARPLTYESIPHGWLSAPLVHLAPLVDEVDPAIVHRFKDATVMMTPQGWMRSWDKEGRVSFRRWFDEDVLRTVDIVVFSRQDIAAAPELEAEFAPVVRHLLVTDGENGGTYYHNGVAMHYDPVPVTELDPTGAGDVFATSLLASLPLLGGDFNRALRTAAQLAAISVTRAGSENAVLPDEIRQALNDARSSG